MFQRQTVLFVKFRSLPRDVQKELESSPLFGYQSRLPLTTSYRLGAGRQEPAEMLRETNFLEFHESCKAKGEFAGTFDEFLGEYRLRALYWVALQNPDLQGIDEVIVAVY